MKSILRAAEEVVRLKGRSRTPRQLKQQGARANASGSRSASPNIASIHAHTSLFARFDARGSASSLYCRPAPRSPPIVEDRLVLLVLASWLPPICSCRLFSARSKGFARCKMHSMSAIHCPLRLPSSALRASRRMGMLLRCRPFPKRDIWPPSDAPLADAAAG